jgi:hypothetical protein
MLKKKIRTVLKGKSSSDDAPKHDIAEVFDTRARAKRYSLRDSVVVND